jgi:hypothetical protein
MFQINHHYDCLEVSTKKETEKAELLTITYIHREFNDRAMTFDIWSPKSAILRTGSQITGLAPWMVRKVETEVSFRN